MAKPIKETPFLCGKDADTFVKENKEVKKVSKEEKEKPIAKEAKTEEIISEEVEKDLETKIEFKDNDRAE